jgi:hypothetical protein
MQVALINTNRLQPPVAPIALDYIAEALQANGHPARLLDLCWEKDPEAAFRKFFKNSSFGLVGMTLRNTDDCAFTSRQSFLADFVGLVKSVRNHTDAPIVLGGVGFSVMPETILTLSEADYGIWGEGEFALPQLASRLEKRQKHEDLPNLIWRRGDSWQRNPPVWNSPAELPAMSRKWLDNKRYFRMGGQAGFETKRGCSGRCIYCADPVAKGVACGCAPLPPLPMNWSSCSRRALMCCTPATANSIFPKNMLSRSATNRAPRTWRQNPLVCLLLSSAVLTEARQSNAGRGLRRHRFWRRSRR